MERLTAPFEQNINPPTAAAIIGLEAQSVFNPDVLPYFSVPLLVNPGKRQDDKNLYSVFRWFNRKIFNPRTIRTALTPEELEELANQGLNPENLTLAVLAQLLPKLFRQRSSGNHKSPHNDPENN